MYNVKKIANNERIDVMSGGKITAEGTQASTVAALTITADLTGVDTGTDMTAAQAAALEVDLEAMAAKLNAALVALKGVGILADS
jgi:hypothetical protein